MNTKIEKALISARDFIESSCIEIPYQDCKYWAFPHFKGKSRVTECGGTSSALSAMNILTPSNDMNKMKVSKALEWLCKRQNSDGAWESSNIYSSETTAMVLCDIFSILPLSHPACVSALNYIQQCYKPDGYFVSFPECQDEPHIFTTYICIKALSLYNFLGSVDRIKIEKWISNSMSVDCLWGMLPRCSYGTLAHTIFALNVLHLCNIPFSAIKKQYTKQIRWIKKQISGIPTKYDTDEIRLQFGQDERGTVYLTLKTYHNCPALMGEFFLNLKQNYLAMLIAHEIILSQHIGGWGPDKDKLTIWATQQNIEFLNKTKRVYSSSSPIYKAIYSINSSKRQSALCLLGIVLFIGTIIWICLDVNRLEDALLSIIASLILIIVPWFIKKE